ncbi:hypothetical protein [Sulfuritalea sp.]|uniref:hypothetical protein n=1 Tax=Sulfuritalea sp. TaxID=2480090 RepID=UPI00391CB90D
MTSITNFLEELRTAAWRTEGARFNAARRLKRRDWFATFSHCCPAKSRTDSIGC